MYPNGTRQGEEHLWRVTACSSIRAQTSSSSTPQSQIYLSTCQLSILMNQAARQEQVSIFRDRSKGQFSLYSTRALTSIPGVLLCVCYDLPLRISLSFVSHVRSREIANVERAVGQSTKDCSCGSMKQDVNHTSSVWATIWEDVVGIISALLKETEISSERKLYSPRMKQFPNLTNLLLKAQPVSHP